MLGGRKQKRCWWSASIQTDLLHQQKTKMNERIQLFDQAEITRRAISLATLNEQPRSVPLMVALAEQDHRTAFAGSPGIPDLLDIDDVLKATLSAFVGFQFIKPGAPSLAFLMKTKYVETILDPSAGPFGTKEVPYSGVAMTIESHYAELEKATSMREWRRRIASYLIEHAERDLLWTDKVGGIDATIQRMKQENTSDCSISSAAIMLKYQDSLKFNLSRREHAHSRLHCIDTNYIHF